MNFTRKQRLGVTRVTREHDLNAVAFTQVARVLLTAGQLRKHHTGPCLDKVNKIKTTLSRPGWKRRHILGNNLATRTHAVYQIRQYTEHHDWIKGRQSETNHSGNYHSSNLATRSHTY